MMEYGQAEKEQGWKPHDDSRIRTGAGDRRWWQIALGVGAGCHESCLACGLSDSPIGGESKDRLNVKSLACDLPCNGLASVLLRHGGEPRVFLRAHAGHHDYGYDEFARTWPVRSIADRGSGAREPSDTSQYLCVADPALRSGIDCAGCKCPLCPNPLQNGFTLLR